MAFWNRGRSRNRRRPTPTRTSRVSNNYSSYPGWDGTPWVGYYPGTGYGLYPGLGWGYYAGDNFVAGVLAAEVIASEQASWNDSLGGLDDGSGYSSSYDAPSSSSGSDTWGSSGTDTSYGPPDIGENWHDSSTTYTPDPGPSWGSSGGDSGGGSYNPPSDGGSGGWSSSGSDSGGGGGGSYDGGSSGSDF